MIRITTALTAVLASLLIAGVAAAGLPGINLKGAKKEGGPYKDLVSVKVAEKRDVFVRAKNVSDSNASASLFQGQFTGESGAYRTRWYRGNENITQEVKGAGYAFNLPSDSRRQFRVEIKPLEPNPGGACLEAQMEGKPFGGNNAFFSLNDGLC